MAASATPSARIFSSACLQAVGAHGSGRRSLARVKSMLRG